MQQQTNEDRLCMGDERGSSCAKESSDRRQKNGADEMHRIKERKQTSNLEAHQPSLLLACYTCN